MRKPSTKLGVTQFKWRRRVSLQVGDIGRREVPACWNWRPIVKNLPTPTVVGLSPGVWRPRRLGDGLSCRAASRRVKGCRFCNAWAASVIQEKSPIRTGIVRAMVRSGHWRWVSTPRWARTSLIGAVFNPPNVGYLSAHEVQFTSAIFRLTPEWPILTPQMGAATLGALTAYRCARRFSPPAQGD